MNLFMVYLAGVCLSGFIFSVCTEHIKSFYTFLSDSIDNAKDDLIDEDKLSDENRILLDNINNDTIITSLLVCISILSWIGIIIDLIYILGWLFNAPKNKK